jgi:thiol-disulfide isomerase/thioredoxin
MMRRFLLTATVLVFFGVCGCEQQTPSPSPKTPDRSRPTPTPQPTHQVLAFTADWCQACQQDKPKLAELRRQGVKVVEIDYDARPDLVRKYRVRRLPTYIVLKDGKEVERTEDIFLLIKILRFIFKLIF